jgi:glycosyltransferase involved in cell wall biosynthesis
VIVGDAPYAGPYIARVRSEADSRVLFPGAIYGEGYRELLAHAAAYIQATEVGGTHPALVEALGYGRVVLYHQSAENEEVAGGAGLPFDVNQPPTLARLLNEVLDAPSAYSVWKDRARCRVAERYRWEDVTDRYEAVLEGKAVIP